MPEQRGVRGPRPKALDPRKLVSVLEYALELPTSIIMNVLHLQRLVIALDSAHRARARHAPESWAQELQGLERSCESRDVRRVVERIGHVGRSPVIRRGDDLAVGDVGQMVQRRIELVPTVADLRAQYTIDELEHLRREQIAAVTQAACALQKGYGEGAREHVLTTAESGARAVIEALHPRAGKKRVDTLVAATLGMANESSLRNRRKRRT